MHPQRARDDSSRSGWILSHCDEDFVAAAAFFTKVYPYRSEPQLDSADEACRRYNASMFFGARLNVFAIFVLILASFALPSHCPAQSAPATPAPDEPARPSLILPVHSFWDRTNILLFSGVAVFRGLDFVSTQNFQRRGRTEILLPDDVVNNHTGFALVEAGGAATSVAISYVFHRTGHHSMERWLSIGHIGVTGFGVAWNFSLKSTHPRPVQ